MIGYAPHFLRHVDCIHLNKHYNINQKDEDT